MLIMNTPISAILLALTVIPLPAIGQVAPPSAVGTPAPSFKPGWVAQGVSFNNGVIGDVPLASAVIGAAQDDAFAVMAKQTSGKAGGVVLKGMINAAETGTYGFVLDIQDGGQSGFCNYALSIDGKPAMAYRNPEPKPAVADKAVELTAGRHPIEIAVGCSRPSVSKVRVALRVKLPSGDAAVTPSADFIIHATRASGD